MSYYVRLCRSVDSRMHKIFSLAGPTVQIKWVHWPLQGLTLWSRHQQPVPWTFKITCQKQAKQRETDSFWEDKPNLQEEHSIPMSTFSRKAPSFGKGVLHHVVQDTWWHLKQRGRRLWIHRKLAGPLKTERTLHLDIIRGSRFIFSALSLPGWKALDDHLLFLSLRPFSC